MTDAGYPVAYAAYLSMLETLFAAAPPRVSDGWDDSDDPGDVIMLGVPNLSDTQAISAGTFDQEQVGFGAAGYIEETGSINGLALAWNGDGDALAARTAAFGYIAAINAQVRLDRSLGVTEFNLAVGTALSHGDVAEDKVDGATCAVSFTVNYTAQLGIN